LVKFCRAHLPVKKLPVLVEGIEDNFLPSDFMPALLMGLLKQSPEWQCDKRFKGAPFLKAPNEYVLIIWSKNQF